MTPNEFVNQWKHSPVVRFPLKSDFCHGLSEASSTALRDHGLPQTAEPWLSFMEFAMVDQHTAAAFEEKELFPVGCLANGSFICIEKPTDRLVIFDGSDPDELWALNSSLASLYESIVLYDQFITEVNRRNPKFASDFRIPHGMLDELRQRLTDCDSESMAAHGFWYCELSALDDSAAG